MTPEECAKDYTIEEVEQDGKRYIVGMVIGHDVVAPVLLDERVDKQLARKRIEFGLNRAIKYFKKTGEWAHKKILRKEGEKYAEYQHRISKEISNTLKND